MRVTGILLVLFLIGPSCSKNPTAENDKTLPVITISSPADGQVYTAGQTITITGSISDDKYIAEVHIHVSNTNTGTLLMDVHIYPASANTTFSQSITAAGGVNYKIQVIAKDRAVNEARAAVEVSCN